MNEIKYYVTLDNKTIAAGMDLDTALMLIKAVFERFYNDHEMVLAVCEEERFINADEQEILKNQQE